MDKNPGGRPAETERDREIFRRKAAGDRTGILAREFGITAGRVRTIVRQQRELAAAAAVEESAAAAAVEESAAVKAAYVSGVLDCKRRLELERQADESRRRIVSDKTYSDSHRRKYMAFLAELKPLREKIDDALALR